MKVLSIVGTRPQLIKLSPLSKEIRSEFEEVIIHTGQHYDKEMDAFFFDELTIPRPDYNLEVGSGTHGYQTGEMIKRIEKKLLLEDPDLVLVYGDSNTTLAGALASVKIHTPVGHVEAGCRTFDIGQPEEINRICVDVVSRLLFAITKGTVKNLLSENIPSNRIFLTGSTIVDSCLYYSKVAEKKSNILQRLGLENGEYYLTTIHRPENVDSEKPLSEIIRALFAIDGRVVFPIHPRTRKNLRKFHFMDKIEKTGKIIATKPLKYIDFMKLMKNSKLILSDSGSIQQESMALKKVCVRLKAVASIPEVSTYRGIRTVPPDTVRILEAVRELSAPPVLSIIQSFESPLGAGNASKKIVSVISGQSNDLSLWKKRISIPE